MDDGSVKIKTSRRSEDEERRRSAGGGQREDGRQESRRATSFLEIRAQLFILK